MSRCQIFANGTLPDLDAARRLICPGDFILAADGGTRHALALGLIPAAVIGDLDSISDQERKMIKGAGVEIIQHPRDKDETDLELALDYAVEQGYRKIVILGAIGGRLDQTLGNLALLSTTRHPSPAIRIDDGVEEAFFVWTRGEVRGRNGDLVSLIPWGGDVHGVHTEGLRWPLSNETLFSHKTRGISNEMFGENASVEIASGLLLVVHRRLKTQK